MAKHLPRWGPVETEVIRHLSSPETLTAAVPRLGDVVAGADHLRAMHEEIGTLGRFQKAAGFTKDRSMQQVSKIDTEVVIMLDQLHEASCTCGKGLWGTDGHKAWYYKWLEGPGAWSDVRGKIALGQQR